MPKKKSLRFPLMPVLLFLLFALLIFVVTDFFRDDDGFPVLSFGAYSGQISGLGGSQGYVNDIYVERVKGAKSLLLVLFEEHWQPQVAPLIISSSKNAVRELIPAGDDDFGPLVINYADKTATLTGSKNSRGYSGKLVTSDGNKGTWQLEPIEASNLAKNALPLSRDFSFSYWLKHKAVYREYLQELETIETNIKDRTDRFERLAKYVNDEAALKERAKHREESLLDAVKAESLEAKQKEEELKNLIEELQQMSRITRKGRAIEQARRAAKREQKWYFANWDQAGDSSDLEGQLAQKMNVDLRKLQSTVKKASEIQELKNAVAKEQGEILKLQEMLREQGNAEQREQLRKEKEEEDKPWWSVW